MLVGVACDDGNSPYTMQSLMVAESNSLDMDGIDGLNM